MDSNHDTISSDVDFEQIRLPLTSTHEITWTVRNVNSLLQAHILDSPPFDLQNATWCLRLYLNNDLKHPFFDVGLNLVRLSSRVPLHRLQYLFKSPDSEKYVHAETADFDESHKENGNASFFLRSKEKAEFQEDFVRVTCRMSCYGSRVQDVFSQKQLSERITKGDRALCENFKNLLLNGPDHDVVLKVRGKEIRAHRIILLARSPLLLSMLSHDTIQKNDKAIDVPDCDPSAFEQFLIYLYSGEVHALDAGNMLSLYDIARKYDMGNLKEGCRDFIKESLSSGNIADVIQAALNHSDADLLRPAMDYFVKEINEILPTEKWLSCMQHNTVRDNELVAKATKSMADLMKMLRKDML